MGVFTLHCDFRQLDGDAATRTTEVDITTNVQVVGAGGVIFDPFTAPVVDGVLEVDLPDETCSPYEFGFIVKRQYGLGLTVEWLVPTQPTGATVELRDYTAVTTLPFPTAADVYATLEALGVLAGRVGAIEDHFVYFGDTAPDPDDFPVWADTSSSPASLKGWDGSNWVAIGGGGSVTLDSDLTELGDLAHVEDSLIQFKGGHWVLRTPAQFKADLALAKGDVGLGNVDNTSDANKPVSNAQGTALNAKAAKSANLSDLTDAAAAVENLGLTDVAEGRLAPAGTDLPSFEAREGGGGRITGHTWPPFAHGGESGALDAEARPVMIDPEELGVERLMFLPGFGVSVLPNAIETPYDASFLHNAAGVAQVVEWDVHVTTPSRYDFGGASDYYLATVVNTFRLYYNEVTGKLTFRARWSTAGVAEAISTEPIPTGVDFDLRVRFKPRGDDDNSPWTCEFEVKQDDGTYQPFGDLIPGDRSINAYVTPTTPPTQVIIGQAANAGAFRGGLIRVTMKAGGTVVADLDFSEWTPNTPTYTDPQGHVWTLNNPQTDENWITEKALVVAPGEIVTDLAGATILSDHGVYPTLSIDGHEWDASNPIAAREYVESNDLIDLAADATDTAFDLTSAPDGSAEFSALQIRTALGLVATQYLAGQLAATARTNAFFDSTVYTDARIDRFTADLSGGVAFNPEETITAADEVRIFGSQNWRSTQAIPKGLTPVGTGDGSLMDQALCLSARSGFFLARGGDGGLGALPTQVTTLTDDPDDPGSWRFHWNAFLEEWRTDQTARMWMTFDQVPEADCTAALDDDGYVTIPLEDDVSYLMRNVTIDGAGLPVGVLRFDPGGTPGPKSYGTTNALVAAGTVTPVLPLSAIDVQGTRLANGVHVDVVQFVSGDWVTHWSNTTVATFNADAASRSITLNGTVPVNLPSGSVVVLAGTTPGTRGHQFFGGGQTYNDMFSVDNVILDADGRGVPAGNLIMRELAWVGDWGGDTVDTGNAKDITWTNWIEKVWINRCEFANPSPFHDVLFGVNNGSNGFTVDWNIFRDHYKAINHFTGADGTGGENLPQFGGGTSKYHIAPPGYTVDDPGPYMFAFPTSKLHGNSFMAPIARVTATWHHNWLLRLGQRAVKVDLYALVHSFCNLHEDGGLPDNGTVIIDGAIVDTGLKVTTRLLRDTDATHAPAQTLVSQFGELAAEWDIYIPHKNATNAALQAIKRTATAGSKAGYTRTANLWLDDNVGSDFYTIDPDFGDVFDPAAFYSYADLVETDREILEARIREGAGPGKQRRMWELVGTASIPSTIRTKFNDADMGSGGSQAAAAIIGLSGSGVKSGTYEGVGRYTEYEILDGDPTATKTATYTALPGETVPVDTSGTGTAAVITLPANPLHGTKVTLVLLGLNGAVTYKPTTGDVFRDTGDATPKSLTVVGRSIEVTFRKSDRSWLRTNDGLPLATADARYVLAGGAASGLTPTAVKTGAYTAAAGDLVLVDTTAGTVAIALPSAPVDKAQVGIQLIAGANTLTVNRGGTDRFDVASTGPTSKTVVLAQQTITWQYQAATGLWLPLSNNLPLSLLDTRYPAAGDLLARVRYQPTTAQTDATTASSTQTDVTAAGITAAWSAIAAGTLDLTFVVPASRVIEVEWEAWMKVSVSGANLRATVADPNGVITFTGIPMTLWTAFTGQLRGRYHQIIDLATLASPAPAAGATITLRPQWATSSGTATMGVGGNNGPIIATVRAA